MQKRGSITHEIYFFMFQVFLVLGTAFFLFSYSSIIVGNTIYEKEALAKDLSLTLNTIQSMPGGLFYNYASAINITKYDFLFSQQKTNIIEQDKAYISHPFFDDEKLNNDFGLSGDNKLLQPSSIFLSKSGKTIQIKQTPQEFQFTQSCPYLETNPESILIDIGSNPTDWGIADSIMLQQELLHSRTKSETVTIQEKIDFIEDSDTDLVISINTKQENNKNKINIYYSSTSKNISKTSAFACFIADSIKHQLQTDILIFSINPQSIYQQDNKNILNITNNSIVYLEIENTELSKNFMNISKGIKNAIQPHYE